MLVGVTVHRFNKGANCFRIESAFKCLHGQLFRLRGVTGLHQLLKLDHTKGHREFVNIRRTNETKGDREGDEVTEMQLFFVIFLVENFFS